MGSPPHSYAPAETGSRLSSAIGYSLKIAAVVFIAEGFIMLFFALFPVENRFLQAAIDSVLLVLFLSPSFYRLIYKPLAREMILRESAQEALKLHADNLEKKVEAKVSELKDREAQFTALFENSNDIIIVTDSEGKVVFWNRQAEDAFGYSRSEAAGREIGFIMPERYKEAHRKSFTESAESGGRRSQGRRSLSEAEGLKKDGALFPVEISISSYEARGAFFVTAIMRDITARKEAEGNIKRQLGKLQALRNIDMAISSSMDLSLTLSILLDQIMSTLQVDAADILLLNADTMRLEYAAGKGFRTDTLRNTRLLVGEGYAGRAALEGRTLCIENFDREAGGFLRAALIEDEDFVSYCSVPLMAKGSLKGVLEVFHRERITPDPELMDFVEAIAMQAAIAIDNASMFKGLYRTNLELTLAYESTIEGWSRALDLRDKETEGHSRRVTEMTVRVGREMGLTEAELIHVRRGALLHDIGKVGIPDTILQKPGPLTEEEWAVMRRHPVYAHELLSPIAHLKPALDIPYCHHEKWDGSGYPRGLKGAEIPLPARVFAVVDIWDALRSDRPYRPAWPAEKVKEYIRSISGKELDPEVVEKFLGIEW